MLLSAVSFAKSKSKTILVRLVSQAGTGFSFNHKRSRLREKLTLLHYDPIALEKESMEVTCWMGVREEPMLTQIGMPPR
ncbi:39S ribosomal protein L33, mitochondrial isoform X2 [Peromyscus californicus insignis]|uniref:39S ribosomal protein L33, mitochondrial isoform X2 n=1 Tax=Peromyscus californicus insignis TaxID=564181 RepID=UPI0022A6EF89|nr:39S ribosomal protein L33, mitochondrial isoform X2 [Peromyscus californicus insignis]